MLLCFFLTCISFIFFSRSLLLKPLPSWAGEMRFLSHWLWKELSFLPIYKVIKNSFCTYISSIPSNISFKKKHLSKVENVEESDAMSVLDLPELALECILESLPPDALCSMAGVCRSLRERCISDHLWEKHMKRKWGKVIGQAAYREWQWHLASRAGAGNLKQNNQRSLIRLFSFGWSLSWIRSKVHDKNTPRNSLPVDSIMAWYLALETGKFWFPAQVYNRENGHVGFMLSCYDAELCYDPRSDTFQARYPPHGRRAIALENGVEWERLRAPPIDTPPHNLHVSDCLNELFPGDHVEIQWRKNKDFPYGWWYGVVGHLETCDGNNIHCRCHYSDTVVLEFNQYNPGSRWRLASINRKEHREEGNEIDGFYGGIRKLRFDEEILMWKQLWPTDILE
ncbi:F-box protein [Cucurbita argyrosperma subsp. argyrosperma]|nr:F-box protein [Cucurbita argyrosperma subsp. argyrosperma]